jgi:hypothetical protein
MRRFDPSRPSHAYGGVRDGRYDLVMILNSLLLGRAVCCDHTVTDMRFSLVGKYRAAQIVVRITN